ncbi:MULTISPECIES: ABC transporter permease [unclassified Inquilinus]|uniref:ABC transporter permease n=1 Tax=unclassified Inquilinus TaxID=2645927 RepID=UPI003F8E94DF
MASLDSTAIEPVRAARPGLNAAGTLAVGLILPVGLALAWEGLAALGVVSTRLLPPPSQILRTLGDLAMRGVLLDHVLTTLGRVAAGFLLGVAAGTALGAATGVWPLARRLLDPTIQALRSIPSIAWVPLFILWFGIFETPKVMLIAVGVFFPVYLTLAGAIASVDRKLVEVGRIYRFGTWDLVRRILLPAALPTYITGLRGGLGLGWMFVVAAEFMGASKGLGYLLVDGQMTGRPAIILAAILLFAVLGKLSDLALAALGARLVRWQDGYRPEGA